MNYEFWKFHLIHINFTFVFLSFQLLPAQFAESHIFSSSLKTSKNNLKENHLVIWHKQKLENSSTLEKV